MTVFTNLDHAPVTASLRLPLALAVPGVFEPGSLATFWAHTPGAFVDMAADLSYTLRRTGRVISRTATGDPVVEDHRPRPADSDSDRESEPESIALDVGLPPNPEHPESPGSAKCQPSTGHSAS